MRTNKQADHDPGSTVVGPADPTELLPLPGLLPLPDRRRLDRRRYDLRRFDPRPLIPRPRSSEAAVAAEPAYLDAVTTEIPVSSSALDAPTVGCPSVPVHGRKSPVAFTRFSPFTRARAAWSAWRRVPAPARASGRWIDGRRLPLVTLLVCVVGVVGLWLPVLEAAGGVVSFALADVPYVGRSLLVGFLLCTLLPVVDVVRGRTRVTAWLLVPSALGLVPAGLLFFALVELRRAVRWVWVAAPEHAVEAGVRLTPDTGHVV